MTIRYQPEIYQDTVLNRAIVIQDTSGFIPESNILRDSITLIPKTQQDSLPGNVITQHNSSETRSDSGIRKDTGSTVRTNADKPSLVLQQADSLTENSPDLCTRNAIADITYWNPGYIISSIESPGTNLFPFLFTEKTRQIHSDRKASIEKQLKTGQTVPRQPFHDDWAIGIILAAIILFSVVRAATRSISPGLTRFFLFRGTKEENSRDFMGIFQWKSTLLNLSSFLIIGLFVYFAADYYKLVPPDMPGVVVWLSALGIIIAIVTLRHLICFITGMLSGQEEVFRDYLHTVHQAYRYNALFLFILIIMMSYSSFLSDNSYFIIGVILFASLYLIRIIRLFILFINRNISIFYLILYLCALEILPVLIITKYFSGLT
jgi:hypothetical protein